MKFISFEVNTGAKNMQIDKDLLDNAIKNRTTEHIFRLYGWSPRCVSLGRNQNADFIDKNLLDKYGLDLVRRLTGGRALLHDKELTYSYICPIDTLENGSSVMESYKEISRIFFEPFKKLGIELEFAQKKLNNIDVNYCMQVSTSADVCYKGRKLIGSAQYRKEGYILQHGSILFDYDKYLLEKIFKEEINIYNITCMREINPNISIFDLLHLWDNI